VRETVLGAEAWLCGLAVAGAWPKAGAAMMPSMPVIAR